MKILENDGLRFDCRSEAELWRARTLLTKEPGTIAWLNEQLREGDVFYDIGANVGCYTLYAARIVGESGHVYAFEPHPANAAALLRNVAANPKIGGRIVVCTTPLTHVVGYRALKLGSLESGTSGSSTGYSGQMMTAVTSVDELSIHKPDLVKIDVDGDELNILEGMLGCFCDGKPRSLQVESAPQVRVHIEQFLKQVRYIKTGAHYTKSCQQQIAGGTSPADVIENAIFQRAA